MQIKIRWIQRDPSRLDFGHIQNIVDQFKQVFAAATDDLQVLPVLDGKGCAALHQLDKAQNSVEGRAQFVTHIGQKLPFGSTGRFGLAARVDKLRHVDKRFNPAGDLPALVMDKVCILDDRQTSTLLIGDFTFSPVDRRCALQDQTARNDACMDLHLARYRAVL